MQLWSAVCLPLSLLSCKLSCKWLLLLASIGFVSSYNASHFRLFIVSLFSSSQLSFFPLLSGRLLRDAACGGEIASLSLSPPPIHFSCVLLFFLSSFACPKKEMQLTRMDEGAYIKHQPSNSALGLRSISLSLLLLLRLSELSSPFLPLKGTFFSTASQACQLSPLTRKGFFFPLSLTPLTSCLLVAVRFSFSHTKTEPERGRDASSPFHFSSMLADARVA